MQISAYCPEKEKRVDLFYGSVKEAKLRNPGLQDFILVWGKVSNEK